MVCGKVTSIAREDEKPKVPEALCKHEHTDFRGSSRTTHRVYCVDCGRYIFECPQEEYKEERK
eukprot:8478351-Lingulodinium_polyedra.AAC.1